MELNDLLGELDRNRGYFPRQAVEEALERREEITPHLLRALEEAAEYTAAADPEDLPFLLLYALYMLAQFREKRAYPFVIKLCKLPGESLDALIGDTITEGLPQIIASVFDGDTAPVESVVEDSTLDEYVRSAALRALSILACEGIVPRAQVIGYLAELFRGRLKRDYSHVWDVLVSEAVDLYAKDLMGDIRQAYEDGMVCTGYMTIEEAESAFALSEEVVLARTREEQRGLIDDVVDEMQFWACFKPRDRTQPKAKRQKPPEFLFAPSAPPEPQESVTVVRSESKIGRNAPCPCGSGKKYKKCCGERA